MNIGRASGTQIAFFTFAVGIVAIPISRAIARLGFWDKEDHRLVEQTLVFMIMVLILFGIGPLRRWIHRELARPVPAASMRELTIVGILKPVLTFGVVGAMVLWYWFAEGPAGLAQRARAWTGHQAELAHAFSTPGLLTLILGVLAAPVLEELLFRGLLYRAWERDWGWLPAAVLTSALFGLYHSFSWSAFVGSLVYVCLYRRTGTLWAPIAVHALYNFVVWYPLAGRFILPRDLDVPGDLATWGFHLAAFLATAVLLPAYLWMSRDEKAAPDFHRTDHEPVPQ